MALTSIENAGDVNTVLDFVLEQPRPGRHIPSAAEACEAAARLADAAHKKYGGAGLTGDAVKRAW